jgi:hypothetical protein
LVAASYTNRCASSSVLKCHCLYGVILMNDDAEIRQQRIGRRGVNSESSLGHGVAPYALR